MRDEHIDTLRKLLRDLFGARYEGVPYARLSRAHGYADGFMAALLRTKVLTQRELLTIIAEERARVAGPSMARLPTAAAST